LVIFLACVGRFFAWRRKKKGEKTLSKDLIMDDFQDISDANPDANNGLDPKGLIATMPLVAEEIIIEEEVIEENLTEENFEPQFEPKEQDVDEPSIDELSDELSIEESSIDEPSAGENQETSTLEYSDEETDDEATPEEGGGVREETEETPPLIRKPGFDKVYDLLNRALTDLDAKPAEPQIPKHYVPRKAMPNLPETVKILDDLDAMFGEAFVMETLKEEVLKALELKEGTSTLPAKDTTQECFVLRLCCNTLVHMLRSGRYHIGKGILNSEGEALVNLFERINSLRTQKTYSTPEEAGRDSAFMRFSVRESGR
jgi:hypothetical protein